MLLQQYINIFFIMKYVSEKNASIYNTAMDSRDIFFYPK